MRMMHFHDAESTEEERRSVIMLIKDADRIDWELPRSSMYRFTIVFDGGEDSALIEVSARNEIAGILHRSYIQQFGDGGGEGLTKTRAAINQYMLCQMAREDSLKQRREAMVWTTEDAIRNAELRHDADEAGHRVVAALRELAKSEDGAGLTLREIFTGVWT